MTAAECYRTLGLPEGADFSAVKRAYRTLAKRYHPDATGSAATGTDFGRIRAAYEDLAAAERRKERRRVPAEGRSSTRAAAATARRPASERGGRGVDVAALGRLACGGGSVSLRLLAVRELARGGKRSSYGYLRKLFYDSDERLVRAAVDAVGKLRIEQSAGELASLFARSNGEIRKAILAAAAEMELRGGLLAIALSGMEDDDPSIRRESVRLYAKYKRIS
ncbi:DnaJ domain-containing protein [Salinispira pacifica]